MTTGTGETRGLDPAAPDRGAIPPDTFAARVMLARTYKGLTIEDAGEATGLNRQSWSNWEKGMKPRDLMDVVQAISEGLGIDRDWLLFGGPLAKPSSRRQLVRRGRRNGGGDELLSGSRAAASYRSVAQRPNGGRPAGHATQPSSPRRPHVIANQAA